MKTLRYRIGNEVRPGILDIDKNIRDASSLVSDWDNENVTIEKLNEIKEKISIKTRQYAKRQSTWARGNMRSWFQLEPLEIKKFLKKIK